MMTWKQIAIALMAMISAQACIRRDPPSPDDIRRQLLVAGTTLLLQDSTLRLFPATRIASDTAAWHVAGPHIDSTSDAIFERTVLRAVRGRASTLSDSAAEKFNVGRIIVRGDTGFVQIDRGSLSCAGGMLTSGGTASTYVFVLDHERWTMVRQQDGLTYDPAVPIPELADRAACARSLAR